MIQNDTVATEPDLSYDQIILVGDSLTQNGIAPNGWATLLATEYTRKMDVIARGFSAYTTHWMRPLVAPLLRPIVTQNTRLVTLLLGSNDSTLPGLSNQHVPIAQYKENLRAIVGSIVALAPQTKVLVITPPPLAARKCWEEYDFDSIKAYREACAEVGHELAQSNTSIGFLDTWPLFVPGREYDLPEFDPASLQHLTVEDRLHLGPEGNRLLAQGVLDSIKTLWPELAPENVIPRVPLNWAEYPSFLNSESSGNNGLINQLYVNARK
ncbi:hypothetical protein HDU79_009644 [Rhizoclosmatium sp. JEL0117]|nr:hypothetical protein HDU79_009644 [Rhizoclosmatium sp. JEL0117]